MIQLMAYKHKVCDIEGCNDEAAEITIQPKRSRSTTPV